MRPGRRNSSAARRSHRSCRHRRCRRRARRGPAHRSRQSFAAGYSAHWSAGRSRHSGLSAHSVTSTRPAGASSRSMPGVAGVTRPFSIAMVTVPMVPWPHIGRQPRGLDEQDRDVAIGAGRRIEDRARHHVVAARLEHQRRADPVVVARENPARFSLMVAPASAGPPPVTRRTGLPQVWPSRQVKLWVDIARAYAASAKRSTSRRLCRRTTRLLSARRLELGEETRAVAVVGLERPEQDGLAAEERTARRLAIAGAP